MIEFKNVYKKYGKKTVIKDLSLTINDGEFLVLIGPSGCGKTTTLRMINRLNKIDGGEILIDGKNIMREDAVDLRRKIGYVIQQIGLFPNMTVEQNITVVLRLLDYPKDKCHLRAVELLEMVDMPFEEYGHKYPTQLSGGQQQRIGVLRALAASPPVILMDEPFGALDPMTRSVLQDEIKKLQRKLKKTIVFVTHDMDEALFLADRICFMDEGEIAQLARPNQMLNAPANGLVRDFLGRRSNGNGNKPPLTLENIMRSKVITASETRSIKECMRIISYHKVDSLILHDINNRYAGSISFKACRRVSDKSLPAKDFSDLRSPEITLDMNPVDCWEELDQSDSDYAVVLDNDRKIIGIITESVIAHALAEYVWGDEND